METTPSPLKFDWNPAKAKRNLAKHGVSFEEAKTVFYDPNLVLKEDAAHSEDEPREIAIGYSVEESLLFVVHIIRDYDNGEVIRIISARPATSQERRTYETTN